MTTRLDYSKVSPAAFRAVMGMQLFVRQSGLELPMLELVKLRASYMNGCAWCVDMHTKDARAAGETEQRLYAVPVWRDTPFFSPRERTALAWTEAVTLLGRDGVSDALYAESVAEFGEEGLVQLTMAVVTINAWNRLNVAFQPEVGQYEVPGA